MILNLSNVSIWSSTFHPYVKIVIVIKWWIENIDVTSSFIKIIQMLMVRTILTQGWNVEDQIDIFERLMTILT